jgi:hypothetical protein
LLLVVKEEAEGLLSEMFTIAANESWVPELKVLSFLGSLLVDDTDVSLVGAAHCFPVGFGISSDCSEKRDLSTRSAGTGVAATGGAGMPGLRIVDAMLAGKCDTEVAQV